MSTLLIRRSLSAAGLKNALKRKKRISYLSSASYYTEEKHEAPSHKIETQFGFEKVDSEKKQEKGNHFKT